MRKETRYKVSGKAKTKPTNLPEGLEVMEVQVTLPAATLTIEPIHGSFGSLTLTETELHGSREGQVAVMMPGHGIFAEEELRKLRDFLNLVLGLEHKMRVFRDSTGDLWFELKPNLFTYGPKYTDDTALVAAQHCRADPDDNNYVDWSLEKLRNYYNAIVEVTDTWEN